jgi:hypothetical protein
MPLTSTLSWYCHRPRHAPHLDSVLVLSSSLPCPSPRLCLGTVMVLAMPLTSTLSWYCHRPPHAPHLDSVLILSSSSPCPSPRLCLGTVIILAMPLTSTLSWCCHHPPSFFISPFPSSSRESPCYRICLCIIVNRKIQRIICPQGTCGI